MNASVTKETVVRAACARDGAMSATEMLGVWSVVALGLPEGGLLDLGSHAGKSSIALAGAVAGTGAKRNLIMVDPLYDMTNAAAWSLTVHRSAAASPWIFEDHAAFVRGVHDAVRPFTASLAMAGEASQRLLPKLIGPVAAVFIDSDDHDRHVLAAEIPLIEPLLVPGSVLLFHDYGNQYIAPREVAEEMVRSGRYAPIAIDWAAVRAEEAGYGFEATNKSWHRYADQPQPNFVGAIRKV